MSIDEAIDIAVAEAIEIINEEVDENGHYDMANFDELIDSVARNVERNNDDDEYEDKEIKEQIHDRLDAYLTYENLRG